MTDNDIIQFTPCPDADTDSENRPTKTQPENDEIIQFTPIDEIAEEETEFPVFTPPVAPSGPSTRNLGLPICATGAFSALSTKQDAIWIEDSNGQWALDNDIKQPCVMIRTITYRNDSWEAEGEYNGTEQLWFGPADPDATSGKFIANTPDVPPFYASKISRIAPRATISADSTPSTKRLATLAAVHEAIEESARADMLGVVRLELDAKEHPTALTLGSRGDGDIGQDSLVTGRTCVATNVCAHAEGEGCSATGEYSHAEGQGCVARGNYSHAEGLNTVAVGAHSIAGGNSSHADGPFSIAIGHYTQTGDDKSVHRVSFAWNGDESAKKYFRSHGDGTFNINPKNGILGFYIGEKNLQDIIDARIKELVKASNLEPTT